VKRHEEVQVQWMHEFVASRERGSLPGQAAASEERKVHVRAAAPDGPPTLEGVCVIALVWPDDDADDGGGGDVLIMDSPAQEQALPAWVPLLLGALLLLCCGGICIGLCVFALMRRRREQESARRHLHSSKLAEVLHMDSALPSVFGYSPSTAPAHDAKSRDSERRALKNSASVSFSISFPRESPTNSTNTSQHYKAEEFEMDFEEPGLSTGPKKNNGTKI